MRTMNSVLLVEDFGPFRALVSSLLREKPDFEVVSEASDGLEAVRCAEELDPDLILMDIGLPGLNGIEAARRIRELAPRSRIVFLTGCARLRPQTTSWKRSIPRGRRSA